ncbi:MAG: hypothetical protein IIA88_03055 [Bacteroidetes bacterium]|nr:hypothetical protein [Bacteroidota bacterium]
MPQNNILQKLELLEGRLKKLLVEYKGLKQELNETFIENSNLKSSLEKQNQKLKNFQDNKKIHSIVSSIKVNDKNSTELKLNINEYIKEIDRCIVSLTEQRLDTIE